LFGQDVARPNQFRNFVGQFLETGGVSLSIGQSYLVVLAFVAESLLGHAKSLLGGAKCLDCLEGFGSERSRPGFGFGLANPNGEAFQS
jgi:hypothetical protein